MVCGSWRSRARPGAPRSAGQPRSATNTPAPPPGPAAYVMPPAPVRSASATKSAASWGSTPSGGSTPPAETSSCRGGRGPVREPRRGRRAGAGSARGGRRHAAAGRAAAGWPPLHPPFLPLCSPPPTSSTQRRSSAPSRPVPSVGRPSCARVQLKPRRRPSSVLLRASSSASCAAAAGVAPAPGQGGRWGARAGQRLQPGGHRAGQWPVHGVCAAPPMHHPGAPTVRPHAPPQPQAARLAAAHRRAAGRRRQTGRGPGRNHARPAPAQGAHHARGRCMRWGTGGQAGPSHYSPRLPTPRASCGCTINASAAPLLLLQCCSPLPPFCRRRGSRGCRRRRPGPAAPEPASRSSGGQEGGRPWGRTCVKGEAARASG